MTEFILDVGSPEHARDFNALDSFTQGYIEAMFFTDSEPGTVRPDEDSGSGFLWNPAVHSSLPGDVGFADLAPKALAKIVADCRAFQTGPAGDLLFQIYESDTVYAPDQAGRDFWYSRNGHGVGFWDRGLGEIGDKLHKAAQAFRQVDSYVGDDGLVYLA